MRADLRPGLALALLAAALAVTPALPGAPAAAHPEDYADADHDGVREPPHGPDNCPATVSANFNPDQADLDADGLGDRCDDDDDGDGAADSSDGCPRISDPNHTDTDGDRRGDVCDDDDDGDGRADARDNCRVVPNPGQADADRTDPGDACPGGAAAGGRPGDDVTAPRVVVRVARAHRVDEVAAGVPVAVSCSEACAATAALESRRASFGTATATLAAAGRTFVFVPLSRAGAGRVRRVRVVVTDVTGNRALAVRALRIGR